jgi:hypothetical protein
MCAVRASGFGSGAVVGWAKRLCSPYVRSVGGVIMVGVSAHHLLVDERSGAALSLIDGEIA